MDSPKGLNSSWLHKNMFSVLYDPVGEHKRVGEMLGRVVTTYTD